MIIFDLVDISDVNMKVFLKNLIIFFDFLLIKKNFRSKFKRWISFFLIRKFYETNSFNFSLDLKLLSFFRIKLTVIKFLNLKNFYLKKYNRNTTSLTTNIVYCISIFKWNNFCSIKVKRFRTTSSVYVCVFT